MDSNKKNNSIILFNAIGQIDDHFIFEAEAYSPKKSAASWRKIIIATVGITLILTLLLSIAVGTLMRSIYDELANNYPSHDASDSDNNSSHTVQEEIPQTLSETLIGFKTAGVSFASPIGREMLFDGETKLIWRYEGEEEYMVCDVALGDANLIRNALEKKEGFTPADKDNENGLDGFWICFGDGLVYSPYLETSRGNVGYGTLFDYDCELEPSADFAQMIKKMIEKSTN